MASISALDWKVEGNDCGFWLRQADPCTQSIHVASVIVAALSAITVLGGVLLILAQQAYPLGGINALAKSIHPIAIYTTIAVAGTVLALDSGFIYALIRGYTNQVLSKEEVEQLQLLHNLKITETDLQPLHYSVFISPETAATETVKAKPGAYTIQSKNTLGQISVVPFSNEESLNAHISRLESLDYVQASEQGFNRVKIPLGSIYHLTDKDWLDKKCVSFASGLPEGYFAFERITLTKDHSYMGCMLFAAKHAKNSEIEFFVAFVGEEKSGGVGAEYLPDCMNLETVKIAVNGARTLNVRKKLENNSFVKYMGSFIHQIKHPDQIDSEHSFHKEQKDLYIITYRTNHSVNEITEFFLTEDSRTKRLEELGFIQRNALTST